MDWHFEIVKCSVDGCEETSLTGLMTTCLQQGESFCETHYNIVKGRPSTQDWSK